MISYVWPIALVVFSNTLYQICAKEVPAGMNAFASLTVTYLVGAVASGLLFLVTGEHGFHRAERHPSRLSAGSRVCAVPGTSGLEQGCGCGDMFNRPVCDKL